MPGKDIETLRMLRLYSRTPGIVRPTADLKALKALPSKNV